MAFQSFADKMKQTGISRFDQVDRLNALRSGFADLQSSSSPYAAYGKSTPTGGYSLEGGATAPYGGGELSADDIAKLVYDMGAEDPEVVARFIAISKRESGWNPGSHNPNGEDSRGLWQINVQGSPKYGSWDLYDPVQNARAMWEMSGGGQNLRPWNLDSNLNPILQHQMPNGQMVDYRIDKYMQEAREAAARMRPQAPRFG